jgi:acyl-CoA synthetase (AMP-forming)/AMP-acid ligase II
LTVSHEVSAGPILHETLLGAVEQSFAARGDAPAFTYLVDGQIDAAETYSFAELDSAARRVAAELQALGVRAGDRVMLLVTPGREMVAGFMGCIFAGAIAVPAPPPGPFVGTRGTERLRSILKDAGATVVLTTSNLVSVLQFSEQESRAFSWVFVDKPTGSADAYEPVQATPNDVAFLQYTSGSTSEPRGVRVTHGALMANIWMAAGGLFLDEDSVACSWLPPFHDMGLIGMILTPLAVGCHTVQMAPEAFLRRPARWLKAISHFGGTVSYAPNFAYETCIRRVGDIDGLDLSAWESAINGAEPIRERTCAEFVRKFGPCGFRDSAFWHTYGLAEATLYVTARRRGPGSTMWVDPDQLSGGRVAPAEPPVGRPLVSCGTPAVGTTVTVCDPTTGEQVEDGVIGEICVHGPHVCDGYWGKAELTARTFTDAGLRSGDLGAFYDGELYVTGRLKDLLIVRGRNHYPQDIEQTMDTADSTLRPGSGVAVSVPTESGDLLVLIQEVAKGRGGEPKVLAEKIRRLVVEQHGVTPDVVALVAPKSVLYTTSGKVRRAATAESFRAGRMKVVHQLGEFGERTA